MCTRVVAIRFRVMLRLRSVGGLENAWAGRRRVDANSGDWGRICEETGDWMESSGKLFAD